jgi:hypothetical protein
VGGEQMTLTASADGRVPETLHVAPGDAAIRVVLRRPVGIAGVVVFPDGRPGAGAKVNGAHVAPDGAFAVPGVRPGRVALLAILREREATWVARAGVDVAEDGTHAPVRLVLEAAPRSWVNVRVLERDGSAVAGISVGSPLLDAVYPLTDASGQVALAFDHPPGTRVRVEVNRSRDDGWLAGRANVVTGPQDGAEVVLRPREPLQVTVTVRLPDGAPLPPELVARFDLSNPKVREDRDTAVIAVDPTDPGFYVGAWVKGFVHRKAYLEIPADGRAELRLERASGTVTCRLVDEAGALVRAGFVSVWARGIASAQCESPGSDGSYRVEGAPAGAVVVNARLDDGSRTARMEAEVRAGETTDLGTIVLRASRALAGRVSDGSGRPVGGARVAARGVDFDKEVFSRSDGSFSILVPVWFDGRLVATKPGYGAVHRPAGESVDLVLGPEGSVRLEVQVPPVTRARSLYYCVRDPVTGFEWPMDRERLDGVSIVRGLPPGRLVLVVKTQPGDVEVEVMVVAGATVSATVRIPE